MKVKGIIMLAALALFLIVALISSLHDTYVCEPEQKEIGKKLDYISNSNSIKDIKLTQAIGWHGNLVNDTFVINDSSIIEKIRLMIKNRTVGEWNHPINKWQVSMIIEMTNKENLNIRVCRISNDTLKQMTHLYFGSKNCLDDYPQYSLELGNYLESLTNYTAN